jgi:FixJ family two-component response regulator
LNDSLTISIVDDDASARAAAARLVRSLGWRARTFSSGEEFLHSQHFQDTCCLITDVQMPRFSGLDLQSRLSAQGQRIPIIFMTAHCEERLKAKALAAGAICFLTKPLEAASLNACIQAAVQRHGREKVTGH